jgi:hypothetical protein
MGVEGRRRALECFNVNACFDRHAHAYQVALEHHRKVTADSPTAWTN